MNRSLEYLAGFMSSLGDTLLYKQWNIHHFHLIDVIEVLLLYIMSMLDSNRPPPREKSVSFFLPPKPINNYTGYWKTGISKFLCFFLPHGTNGAKYIQWFPVSFNQSFRNLSTCLPRGWENGQNPGCLGYIGDYTTQLYRDCYKPL